MSSAVYGAWQRFGFATNETDLVATPLALAGGVAGFTTIWVPEHGIIESIELVFSGKTAPAVQAAVEMWRDAAHDYQFDGPRAVNLVNGLGTATNSAGHAAPFEKVHHSTPQSRIVDDSGDNNMGTTRYCKLDLGITLNAGAGNLVGVHVGIRS